MANVHLLNEEREPLQFHRVEEPTPRPIVQMAWPAAQTLGALHAIAAIVAARILLLLALVGFFALALIVVRAPSVSGIVMASLFAALTVIPLTLLALRRT